MKKTFLLTVFVALTVFNTIQAQHLTHSKFDDERGKSEGANAFINLSELLKTECEKQTLKAFSDPSLKNKIAPAELEKLFYGDQMMQLVNPDNNPPDPYDLIDTVVYGPFSIYDCKLLFSKGVIGIAPNPDSKSMVYIKASSLPKAATNSYRILSLISQGTMEPITLNAARDMGELTFNQIQGKIYMTAKTEQAKVYLQGTLAAAVSWTAIDSIGYVFTKKSTIINDRFGLRDTLVSTPFEAINITGLGISGEIVRKKDAIKFDSRAVSVLFQPNFNGIVLSSVSLCYLEYADVKKMLSADELLFMETLFETGFKEKLNLDFPSDY